MLIKTLKQGFRLDNIVQAIITSITKEAKQDLILLNRATYSTQGSKFKAAKKAVLDAVTKDDTFTPYFNKLPPEQKDAALNSLQTFINKDIRGNPNFCERNKRGERSRSIKNKTNNKLRLTTLVKQSRQGSTALNRSARATVLSCLSLFNTAAKPLLLTALLFLLTRINFFVLLNRY